MKHHSTINIFNTHIRQNMLSINNQHYLSKTQQKKKNPFEVTIIIITFAWTIHMNYQKTIKL